MSRSIILKDGFLEEVLEKRIPRALKARSHPILDVSTRFVRAATSHEDGQRRFTRSAGAIALYVDELLMSANDSVRSTAAATLRNIAVGSYGTALLCNSNYLAQTLGLAASGRHDLQAAAVQALWGLLQTKYDVFRARSRWLIPHRLLSQHAKQGQGRVQTHARERRPARTAP